MNVFSSFVEANRQTGSTTALAEAAVREGAVLVVPNDDMRKHVVKNTSIQAINVVTLYEIKVGRSRIAGRKIFVDPACLCKMG